MLISQISIKNLSNGLSSLKCKVDELDIGKLQFTPVDLIQLSDVVKNYVVKKTEYDELIKNVSNIKTTDTIDLVKKTDYNTKDEKIEKKITDHEHGKYFTTQKFNKVTAHNFAARLKQANLSSKNNY